MVVAVLVVICCRIPCICSLCVRFITTAVEDKFPPPYQMPLLESKTRALVGGHLKDSYEECGDEYEASVGPFFKKPKGGFVKCVICDMCHQQEAKYTG